MALFSQKNMNLLLGALLAASLAGCAARPLSRQLVAVYTHTERSDADLLLILVDQQGAVIGRADVTLQAVAGDRTYAGRTDDCGEAHLAHLSPGDYVMDVKSSGFKSPKSRLTLQPGQVVKMMLELKIDMENTEGGPTPAEQPLVETDTSQLSKTFSSREITDLPHR